MTRLFVPNVGATVLLTFYLLFVNLVNALYAAHGVEPSEKFSSLSWSGIVLLLAFWVHADCRRLGRAELLDQGFFFLSAWPLALPYHLLKTRGVKGLLTLVGLVGLFLATYALTLPVFFAIQRAVE